MGGFIIPIFVTETKNKTVEEVINEIEKEWLSIKNINIQELTLKVLSINNNIAIINWYLLQDNKEYDGIYEIKFNEKLECIYFKSWCEENDS